MNVKNLEITRRLVQITTIIASMGLAPLGYFTPWSTERVVEQIPLGTGTYTTIYSVFHYNIYLGLAFFLPMIGLLTINGSVKRFFKRVKAESISPVRVSPTETVFVAQNSSKNQQIQQVGVIKLNYCVICGQPNDYDSKFCKYFLE